MIKNKHHLVNMHMDIKQCKFTKHHLVTIQTIFVLLALNESLHVYRIGGLRLGGWTDCAPSEK